jgi:hypothetical protein
MNDRYTKGCLTVIAVSLAVIGLRGHPPVAPPVKPAPKKAEVQKVVLCVDKAGKYCGSLYGVNVKVINEPSVSFYQPVTVHNDGSFAH